MSHNPSSTFSATSTTPTVRTLREQSDTSLSDFWGEPIHTYTREQAIEDGLLIDAQVGDLADVTRQHFGDTPVAMTAALFALIQKAVSNPKYWNDFRGVWHDICFMRRFRPQVVTTAETRTRWFKVIITGTGRKRYHTLKMVEDRTSGEITFMLQGED